MDWIALSPRLDDTREAWLWWSLRFTPRVARVEEAILLEVSGSLRLFGGRKALLKAVLQGPFANAEPPVVPAKAGTQRNAQVKPKAEALGPRLRGDEQVV